MPTPTWKETWVSKCNSFGNWTQIKVSNYTSHTLKAELQIAGVTYRTEIIEPLDGELYDPETETIDGQYHPNGFSNANLTCGFAWYSIRICIVAPSAVTEELVQVCPPFFLHFVYGGSLVLVRIDDKSPSRIIAINRNHKANNEHSKNLSSLVSTAGALMNKSVDSATLAKLRLQDTVRKSFSGTKQSKDDGTYGSSYFNSEADNAKEGSEKTPNILRSWQFSGEDDENESGTLGAVSYEPLISSNIQV